MKESKLQPRPLPHRDLSKFKELKSFSVYVRLFSQTQIDGVTRSVFKIIVEDNISHHRYLGYSLEKSQTNIDLFVNYVLSNLQMRGNLDKNYQLTSGRNLLQQDTDNEPNLPKEKKHKVIRSQLSHSEIITRIYKELILNNDGYTEIEGYSITKNPILPPLFVDSLLKDFDKITKFTDFWHDYEMNDIDNAVFLESIKETGKEIEKYENEFNFKKALNLYNRLISAADELKDSEKFTARILIKKAKIHFHLEEYDKCKEIIESNIEKFEKLKLKEELGEFYYYLGMISSYSNKYDEADNYFSRSSRLLNNVDSGTNNFYFRSRIRRYILRKDYTHALTLINRAVRYFFRLKDLKELCFLYGLKAENYIRMEKYSFAIDSLNIQLDYAKKTKNMIAESKCIVQIFSIITFTDTISEDIISEYLRRIKKLSKIIKKNSYYYNALTAYAIFLYRIREYTKSENLLKKAIKIYSPNTTDPSSHSVNLIYLANIKIFNNNYYGAVILLHKILKFCKETFVTFYPPYILNTLGQVYHDQKKYKKSNKYLLMSIKRAENDKINDIKLKASSYKYLGINNYYIKKIKVSLNFLNKSLELYNKLTNKDTAIEESINVILSIVKEINIKL